MLSQLQLLMLQGRSVLLGMSPPRLQTLQRYGPLPLSVGACHGAQCGGGLGILPSAVQWQGGRACPACPRLVGAGAEEYVAPADDVEAAVQRVFAAVLGRPAEELSVLADFFAAGGTSRQCKSSTLLRLKHWVLMCLLMRFTPSAPSRAPSRWCH